MFVVERPWVYKYMIKWKSFLILKQLKTKYGLDVLKKFRAVEKFSKKYISCEADTKFLKYCIDNQLAPKIVNFKLYRDNLRYSSSSMAFKFQLLKDEIDVKKRSINDLTRKTGLALLALKSSLSYIDFYACICYLHRLLPQYKADITERHHRKLYNLYDSRVFLTQDISHVYNLSNHTLSKSEYSLLNKGLKFAIKKRRSNSIDTKIELENLYSNIFNDQKNDRCTINNEEALLADLKSYGHKTDSLAKRVPDPLTREEKSALAGLKANDKIVITRSDKGGDTVILDREDYLRKLESILVDADRFSVCGGDQSNKIKVKINKILHRLKNTEPKLHKQLKIVGEYDNGFLYGLPKLHKDRHDPPLRPIVSMSGTVTHELAQTLNHIIRPYLNEKYLVKSSYELLLNLDNLKQYPMEKFYSLDVQSLFTNVPVNRTIDIIANHVYHSEIAPPSIPEHILRELLLICTTMTPFDFNGKTYKQVDGVSMGSPLGPTFADFYMAELENTALNMHNVPKPIHYFRYVDDTLAIFNSYDDVLKFIEVLHCNSVLQFTFEQASNNQFQFLDIKFQYVDGKLETGIFTKSTDTGLYFDYSSFVPDLYKKSVVKTLVYRAYKLCSNWKLFDKEICRITQNLVNNNFPQHIIDNIINNTVMKLKKKKSDDQLQQSPLQYYFNTVNLQNFRRDRGQLGAIIRKYVSSSGELKPTVSNYYKPTRLSSQFSLRPSKAPLNSNSVVYNFSCPKPSCQAEYVGYTTNMLKTRATQHKYKPSKIHQHFVDSHDTLPKIENDFLSNFKILYRTCNRRNLFLAEALLIRKCKPYINVRYNELNNVLNIFK